MARERNTPTRTSTNGRNASCNGGLASVQFGRLVTARRSVLGLSQEALALRMRTSRAAVERIEAGQPTSPEALQRLCAALSGEPETGALRRSIAATRAGFSGARMRLKPLGGNLLRPIARVTASVNGVNGARLWQRAGVGLAAAILSALWLSLIAAGAQGVGIGTAVATIATLFFSVHVATRGVKSRAPAAILVALWLSVIGTGLISNVGAPGLGDRDARGPEVAVTAPGAEAQAQDGSGGAAPGLAASVDGQSRGAGGSPGSDQADAPGGGQGGAPARRPGCGAGRRPRCRLQEAAARVARQEAAARVARQEAAARVPRRVVARVRRRAAARVPRRVAETTSPIRSTELRTRSRPSPTRSRASAACKPAGDARARWGAPVKRNPSTQGVGRSRDEVWRRDLRLCRKRDRKDSGTGVVRPQSFAWKAAVSPAENPVALQSAQKRVGSHPGVQPNNPRARAAHSCRGIGVPDAICARGLGGAPGERSRQRLLDQRRRQHDPRRPARRRRHRRHPLRGPGAGGEQPLRGGDRPRRRADLLGQRQRQHDPRRPARRRRHRRHPLRGHGAGGERPARGGDRPRRRADLLGQPRRQHDPRRPARRRRHRRHPLRLDGRGERPARGGDRPRRRADLLGQRRRQHDPRRPARRRRHRRHPLRGPGAGG